MLVKRIKRKANNMKISETAKMMLKPKDVIKKTAAKALNTKEVKNKAIEIFKDLKKANPKKAKSYGDMVDKGVSKGKEYLGKTVEKIKANPKASVGIAAGAGMVAGGYAGGSDPEY